MQKSSTIEALRVMGALGIVWYHARGPGYDIAYSGLVLFLILSFYLAGNKPAHPPSPLRRAQRLLQPWLLWMLVYGAVNLATHQPLIDTQYGVLAGVLAGTSIHLWYLPFIFFCLIAYDQLRRIAAPGVLAMSGAAMAAVLLMLAPLWRPLLQTIGFPLAQYLHAAAGVGLGLYFANASVLTWQWRLPFNCILLLVAALALPVYGIGLPYLLGIAAGWLLTAPPLPANVGRWINPLGAATFGVYCCHILVMRIIAKFTHVDGWLLPVLTFVISMAAVLVAQQLRERLLRGLSQLSARSRARLQQE
jgi:fucose 4-O-acetylase-like acetyltransferase